MMSGNPNVEGENINVEGNLNVEWENINVEGNPNVEGKKIPMLKGRKSQCWNKENPNDEGEIQILGGEDEKAVDWLKPNWGTRHACGNLVRHHIIHLLAAQHTKEDRDDVGEKKLKGLLFLIFCPTRAFQ